ncbi:hypothetical protein TRAPUB_7095 [Trametes pubescens]|uniref:Uncharacterized protein n=1 Tax=Trametes pubescens TaxID=154538 RepID=A0A1M2V433_TRAPU|nr:hypothetical protein TRAPUB_7095 [Trametes pubescens]
MLHFNLSLLLCGLALLMGTVVGHAPVKRDDNLPARVPYVFPAPGTDSVRRFKPIVTRSSHIKVTSSLQDEGLAAGWNALATVVRDNNSLPAPMRELFHEPVGREVGLTLEQLLEIRLTPAFLSPLTPKTSLTPELSAALLLADFMTNAVKVPQPVFDGLHKFLDDKQMVDAVATVGTYNLVSRFVLALDVDSKADVPVPLPE